ncbi:ABC transporter substrate-binding protein, partial [Thermodesulfobacteriota bacterium]
FEHATRLAMLKAGEADIVELIGPHIPAVKSDPNLTLHQIKYVIGYTLEFSDLLFPDEQSPFKDIRVRKAVSLAIDRKMICEKILFGDAEPWGEVLCPYNFGYDSSIKPDPYDPEKAIALLKEAGYPKGFETRFCTSIRDKYYVEPIVSNLADIGIVAKLEVFEGGAWYGAHKGRKLRGIKTRSTWYDAEPHPGADILEGLRSSSQWAYGKLPGVDEALDASLWAKNDEEAAEWGRKLSKMVRKDYRRPILWAKHSSFGLSKKIVKWEPQGGSYPGTRFEYIEIKE